jgi:hypothetical protein
MAEANTAAAEQAVEAAFNVSASIPPVSTETAVPAPVSEAPAATEAPAPKPEKPQYARVLEKDWNDLKATAGRLPALESQIARLTSSIPKADALTQQIIDKVRSDTPQGHAVTFDKEDFAELAENYPELASQLERVLNKAKVKGTGSSEVAAATPKPPAFAVDQAALGAAIKRGIESGLAEEKAKAQAEARQQEGMALLEAYPDYTVIVGSPDQTNGPPKDTEWRRWLAKQPEPYRQKVSTTWSPAVVHQSIDKFKSEQKASSAPAKPDKAAIRRAVIADATTPRFEGNAPPLNQPVSAEEAFVSARRRI